MHFLIPTLAVADASSLSSSLGFAVYVDETSALTLELTREDVHVASVALDLRPMGSFGGRQIYGARVAFPGLRADTVHRAVLRAEGGELDRCSARTWPAALGGDGAPFEILLGSCYSTFTRSDGGNDLGHLTAHLSQNRLPHLKLLCGDQVYQDIPVRDILPPAGAALQTYLLNKYLANWSSSKALPAASFGDFLRCGSTLFVTDDHEYWNNYPYFMSYGPHLWEGAFREAYTRTASELAALFQLVPPTLRTLALGSGNARLSLAVLDGRRLRDGKADRAHSPADLARLATFLREATSPVVLVLSQPLFQESAGWLQRTFVDRGLADLKDYGLLVDAIAGCRHDVLVLSGDIHGGRVSSVQRVASATRTGQQLVEVIASPLSLVHPGGYLDHLPDFAYPEPGKGQRSGSYGRITNHFGPVRHNHAVSLRLWAKGESVACSIDYITTRDAKNLGGPTPPFLLR